MIVSPELFKQRFLEAVCLFESRLVAAWGSGEAYSQLFQRDDPQGGLFRAIAERLGLKYCDEYFKFDAVLYERPERRLLEQKRTECILVAIEHETQAQTSIEEMNKLAILNAPLKVLITYEERQKQAEYLGTYAEMLHAADVFEDFGTLRRHLVIFGDRRGQKINWSFHLFNGNSFDEIY